VLFSFGLVMIALVLAARAGAPAVRPARGRTLRALLSPVLRRETPA
jgi:hypothetical protein